MKITIFTSDNLRHINLVNQISKLGHECYAIIEKKGADNFQNKSLKKKYFLKVLKAEKKIFKKIKINKKINCLFIKWGKLKSLKRNILKQFLSSDLFIIFGSSYIKGWLCNYLIKKKAINIHMGISPFYRGAGCNFWAVYDNNIHLVGATIHYLSKDIDNGKILFHVLPSKKYINDFDFTMGSVLSAQKALISSIKSKKIFKFHPFTQNKKKEIRYSKIKDFNNTVIKNYFKNKRKFKVPNYNIKNYIHPYFDR